MKYHVVKTRTIGKTIFRVFDYMPEGDWSEHHVLVSSHDHKEEAETALAEIIVLGLTHNEYDWLLDPIYRER